MMTRILAKGYLWLLLALLYSPILIIMIFSFTEAKVLGNWTGFSTKLYSSLFTGGMHHSLMNAIWNTFAIAMLAATASTALGSIAAIGIFNLRTRTRQVMNFANAIPMIQAAGLGLAFCAKPKTQLAADKAINDRDLTHVLDYLRR